MHRCRVVELGTQRQVSQRRGEHLASNGQNPARLQQRALEVARHLAHRNDEQVSKTMPVELGAMVEPVLEQVLHEGFHIG